MGICYLDFSVEAIYLEVSVYMHMLKLVWWRRTLEGNGSGSVGKSLLSRGSPPSLGASDPFP